MGRYCFQRLLSFDTIRAECRPSANPPWDIPPGTLHGTSERPLFSPSCRAPMPAVIAPSIEQVKTLSASVELEQSSLSLLGVVIYAADTYAVFV